VQWTLHDELPLAAITPADVLEGEDVTVGGEEAVVVADHSVARDAVGGAGQQEGKRLVRALRLADAGIELDPVAHGDLHQTAVVLWGRGLRQ
jgi:hypothetical protein